MIVCWIKETIKSARKGAFFFAIFPDEIEFFYWSDVSDYGGRFPHGRFPAPKGGGAVEDSSFVFRDYGYLMFLGPAPAAT